MMIPSLPFGSLSPTITPSKYANESIVENDNESPSAVTLQQVKQYLPVFDTNSDDLIQGILDGVVKQVERYINRDVVERERVSLWNLPAQVIKLPYGPHREIVVEQHIDGEWQVIPETEYDVIGLQRKQIRLHYGYPTKVSCLSGFEQTPSDIQQAIINETAFQFKNRNDPNEVQAETKFGLSIPTLNLLSSYK